MDSGDPDTVVVSAAASPRSAHDLAAAEAGVYRRSSGGMHIPGVPPMFTFRDPDGNVLRIVARHQRD